MDNEEKIVTSEELKKAREFAEKEKMDRYPEHDPNKPDENPEG